MKSIIIAIVLTLAGSAAIQIVAAKLVEAHHYAGHGQCRTSSGTTYYC